MFSNLSKKDISSIEYYIRKNALIDDYDFYEGKLDLEYILRHWSENKKTLYNLLDKNLILTKNISYKKDIEEIVSDFRKMRCDNSAFYTFNDNWNKAIYNHFFKEKDTNIYWNLNSLLDSNSLASNTYSGNSCEFMMPNGKKYSLNKGCKVMKAIGKIANAYNIEGFEDFRNAHSQILNETSLSGELCLSIHPLDFMTMSDNNCGWTSCMSWVERGEYRVGTVEMMNSPLVVCAYLKSSTDMYDGNFTWNSKRWRELFIVHNGILIGVKGYPYWNQNLEKITLNWIKELAEKNLGFGPYEDNIVFYNASYNRKDFTTEDGVEIEDVRCGFVTNRMYNDFAYTNHMAILNQHYSEIPDVIKYSGKPVCMICGEEHFDYNSEQEIACLDCDPHIYCAECGCLIEDPSYDNVVGDNYYCDYCYNEIFNIECPSCGGLNSEDNMVTVHLALDHEHMYRNVQIYICYDCFCAQSHNNSNLIKSDAKEYVRYNPYPIRYFLAEDLTDEGRELFDKELEYDYNVLNINPNCFIELR